MVICRSYRPSTKLLVKIIPVLVLNVIALATLNSCKSNTLDQPNDKHAVEEASQETIPEEPKLIGVSDDIGYNFDKKPGYEYLQVNIEVSVKEEGTYFINSDRWIPTETLSLWEISWSEQELIMSCLYMKPNFLPGLILYLYTSAARKSGK